MSWLMLLRMRCKAFKRVGEWLYIGFFVLMAWGFASSLAWGVPPGGPACDPATKHWTLYSDWAGWGCAGPSGVGWWYSGSCAGGLGSYYGRQGTGCAPPSSLFIEVQCWKCVTGGSGDTDGDGVEDPRDPWPNDPNCPNEGEWAIASRYTRKSDGCTFTTYFDIWDQCPDFGTWSCSGTFPGIINPGDWWADFPHDNSPKDYNDIMPPAGGGPGGGDGTDIRMDVNFGPLTSILSEIEGNTEGALGQLSSIASAVGGLGGKIDSTNSLLGGISSGISTSNSSLSSIAGGIGSANTTLGNINTGVSGLGGKLDSVVGNTGDLKTKVDLTNTKLDEIKTGLTDVKDAIPGLGDEELPTGEVGAIEDNGLVGEDVADEKLSEAKDWFSSVLDSFLVNNPLVSVINNTQIVASGSASVDFNWGKYGSSSSDGSQYGGVLDLMGLAFVAICSISGLVAVLRD